MIKTPNPHTLTHQMQIHTHTCSLHIFRFDAKENKSTEDPLSVSRNNDQYGRAPAARCLCLQTGSVFTEVRARRPAPPLSVCICSVWAQSVFVWWLNIDKCWEKASELLLVVHGVLLLLPPNCTGAESGCGHSEPPVRGQNQRHADQYSDLLKQHYFSLIPFFVQRHFTTNVISGKYTKKDKIKVKSIIQPRNNPDLQPTHSEFIIILKFLKRMYSISLTTFQTS